MKNEFKPYYDAVAYLEKFAATPHDQAYMKTHSAHPERFLERTAEFVRLLGNPHRGLKVVHVSGTAGKGSTVTYIHEMLRGGGFRVGSFTSPYATTSIEKIRVNDALIDPLAFAGLVEKAKPAIKRMDTTYQWGRPSYFEIFFGLALLYFKKMRCEWAVLEVGCGGTYDAGTIIPQALTAATNVGLDHQALLGNTLAKIAREKAGIIRRNSHFFTTERRKKILALFRAVCRSRHTVMHPIAAPRFEDANIALAAAVARHIGISEAAIQRAQTRGLLPCRFEVMQQNPLVIQDGAHNPDKIRSVVHNLKSLTYRKLYTIFASSSNKDAAAMLRLIGNVSTVLVLTQFKNEARAAYAPETLKKLANHPQSRIERDPKRALREMLKKLTARDALLVTGSFYLVGELRKKWIPEGTILKTRHV